MMRAASLQRRLSVGLAVVITVMWLVATLAAGLVVRQELDEAFDSGLQETAQRLLPLAVADILNRDATTAATGRRLAALSAHDELLTYLVRDASGELLIQSHDANPDVFPDRPQLGFRTTASHRIYGEAVVSGTVLIEIAEPLTLRRVATIEAALAVATPLLILVPLSLIGVWWLVRRTMRPVLDLKAQIEARGGDHLSPVAAGGLPTEIRPIAESVNLLLDRLRRVIEAERSFAANSAHELRTPIAAALAQTQRLIAEGSDTAGDRARRIEATLRNLAGVSEKLMQLARAEGGGLLAETETDLAPVLTYVIDDFRRGEEGGARLRFNASTAEGLWSRMDPDAFAILVRNLVENALKHSPAETPIEIVAGDDGAIHVINAGPVLPATALAQLRGRFVRGATETRGVGLGLAIADAIASGAGAKLDLFSPATGRTDGFEARLILSPLSRDQ